ncbi:hypothetical protein chiPu_0010268 [Chiloscyllium punctatum]|uniref:Uncharacterized protein n=1 Tax=Chiloscyllium punctatum TaxID=137246 RepID=A0A401SN43_CHIPU|nr:hypothetical protein [Chiloscyllium punctatum]
MVYMVGGGKIRLPSACQQTTFLNVAKVSSPPMAAAGRRGFTHIGEIIFCRNPGEQFAVGVSGQLAPLLPVQTTSLSALSCMRIPNIF